MLPSLSHYHLLVPLLDRKHWDPCPWVMFLSSFLRVEKLGKERVMCRLDEGKPTAVQKRKYFTVSLWEVGVVMNHGFSSETLHLIWESKLPTFLLISLQIIPQSVLPKPPVFWVCWLQALVRESWAFRCCDQSQRNWVFWFYKFAMVVHCLIHLQSWNNSSVSTILNKRKKPTWPWGWVQANLCSS